MKFSIITPSFKQVDWLKCGVASVWDQMADDIQIEHLIQDGGTAGIAEEFSEFKHKGKGYSFSLVSEKDGGMYAAINKGLRRATGEVCAWLNCDEQYLVGSLRKVAIFFKAHPEVEVVFGDALLTDSLGHALSYRTAILPESRHVRFSHLNTLSCAMFFRRSIIDKVGLLDVKWKAIGDAVWIAHMLEKGVRMGVYNEPLSVFTWMPENLSNSQRATEEATVWRKGFASYNQINLWKTIIRHRLNKLLHGAYRKREVSYAIFTRQNCDDRTAFHAKVEWKWPKNNRKERQEHSTQGFTNQP